MFEYPLLEFEEAAWYYRPPWTRLSRFTVQP